MAFTLGTEYSLLLYKVPQDQALSTVDFTSGLTLPCSQCTKDSGASVRTSGPSDLLLLQSRGLHPQIFTCSLLLQGALLASLPKQPATPDHTLLLYSLPRGSTLPQMTPFVCTTIRLPPGIPASSGQGPCLSRSRYPQDLGPSEMKTMPNKQIPSVSIGQTLYFAIIVRKANIYHPRISQ